MVLSIDGCRPDALEPAGARNLLQFGATGASAARALTIPLSFTLPSHSSMLSGYDLEHHGVDWNVSLPEKGYIKVPTIFAVAKQAGLHTVMITGKDKLLTLLQPGTIDEFHQFADDEAVIDHAISVAGRGNFDLMFIHSPEPDLTGHVQGWMSEPYLAQVTRIDEQFGRLLAALPADTTMIVTADHGGFEFGHGTDTEIDRRIPWMINGPLIRKRHIVSREILTMDTAATALKLLGLQLETTAQGRIVNEVFAN